VVTARQEVGGFQRFMGPEVPFPCSRGPATGPVEGRMCPVCRLSAGAGFSRSHRHTLSVAHPASYPMSTVSSSPGVRRQGREADHSPPSSAEVCVELYLHFCNTCSWRVA